MVVAVKEVFEVKDPVVKGIVTDFYSPDARRNGHGSVNSSVARAGENLPMQLRIAMMGPSSNGRRADALTVIHDLEY